MWLEIIPGLSREIGVKIKDLELLLGDKKAVITFQMAFSLIFIDFNGIKATSLSLLC